jgi:hypothetical protein
MASSLAPIAVVPLLLVLLSSVAFLLVVKKQRSFLPLVPVIQDHWLLGIANFIDAKKMRNILTTRGKDLLVQFSFMGHKILAIGDRQVAKVALKEITGKGFFHNPTPSFVTSGIFSLDTGPEWQQRRAAFRKAFSISSLRRHTTSVARLNEKMRTVLDRAAGSGEVIKIDNIFSQLTVGVICELAFELDIKVFESSTNSLNIDDVMARFFEVTPFILTRSPLLSLIISSMPGSASYLSRSISTASRSILSISTKQLETSSRALWALFTTT